jgi:hypothetical protein
MRPKYIAGPMTSRSNARFIPHMGNRVPFGIVRTASTYLIKQKTKNKNNNSQNYDKIMVNFIFFSRGEGGLGIYD